MKTCNIDSDHYCRERAIPSPIFSLMLICALRHGCHVGGQEQKHFSPVGTKLYFHFLYFLFSLAPKRAKQLSMATILLCFEFFRCRVDVWQSYFSRSTISIAVFCLQNLLCLLFIFADQVFIDPPFFGIFVCGPLQSFVVYVCTLFSCKFLEEKFHFIDPQHGRLVTWLQTKN